MNDTSGVKPAGPDGGPAFPGEDFTGWYLGMSLRDWLAGQALVGLLVNQRAGKAWDDQGALMFPSFARSAYGFADAMLRERKRREEKK